MIELPEAITLGKQANEVLKGKRITHVFNATKYHRFTFYHGDPLKYGELLTGRTIESAKGYGMFVDLFLDNGVFLSIGDGTNMRYGKAEDKIPANYQLLLGFDDESFLVFTVAMYGMIGVCTDRLSESKYHKLSMESISPLDERYTEEQFFQLFSKAKKDLTAKALLATGQRIPGVGNGVLQDILFNAKIHPKRKISTFSDTQKTDLYHALKNTLQDMTFKGGRDTQSDLLGNYGGYKTILSSKTWKLPCPVCGGQVTKEAYMGGSIYYCPVCQS